MKRMTYSGKITTAEAANHAARTMQIVTRKANFETGPEGVKLFIAFLRERVTFDAARKLDRIDRMERRVATLSDPKAKLAAKIARLQAKLAELDAPAQIALVEAHNAAAKPAAKGKK